MDKIEPAVTPEEWAVPHVDRESLYASMDMDSGLTLAARGGAYMGFVVDQEDIPALIALANAALRNSDRRKITPDHARRLRLAAGFLRNNNGDADFAARLDADAEGLESYLPPEK